MTSPVPLELIPFGIHPFGLKPFGWGPAPTPPASALWCPHRSWAGWLSDRIGRPINLGRFVQGIKGPRLAYHVIDAESMMSLDGPAGLCRLVAQIDAYGEDPEDPGLLQRAVFRAMAGYRGPTGLGFLHSAIPGRTQTDFFPSPSNAGGGSFRESVDWTLWLTE